MKCYLNSGGVWGCGTGDAQRVRLGRMLGHKSSLRWRLASAVACANTAVIPSNSGQHDGHKSQTCANSGIKKYTANKLIEAIRDNPQESRRDLLMWLFERAGKANSNNTNYQFWQQHSHPIELSTNEILDQRLHYVHNNPVEAGIVLSPEHYLYSSALNYAGLPEKLLEVILIECCLMTGSCSLEAARMLGTSPSCPLAGAQTCASAVQLPDTLIRVHETITAIV